VGDAVGGDVPQRPPISREDPPRAPAAHRQGRECGWSGVEGDSDHVGPCLRPAVGCVEDAEGRREYTCEEHISHARSLLPSGVYYAGITSDDQESPLASRSAARSGQRGSSVVGHVE
jgi:hypothetical protein